MTTTLTIKTPFRLTKTEFDSPLDAGTFLLKLAMRQIKKQAQDTDRTKETQKNKIAYKQSMDWNNEHFSLSQAKQLIVWDVK